MAVEIHGRVVAVTGGARGIGRAIAAELARAGARVAIGDVDRDAAEQAAAAIGDGVPGLGLDVTDRTSMDAFADAVEERLGPIDVFVNNAGIMSVGRFLDEDDAVTERQIAVNLMGVVHGMRSVLPRMLERGRGQMVNVISGSAYVTPPGEVSYSATKHGALALTDGVREELRDSGVVLTAVFPGLVRTELAEGTKAPRATKWISPDDVARGVAWGIREQRAEVFVPRELAFLLRLNKSLTASGRRRLARLFDMDVLAARTDPAERAGYMRRIGLDA